MAIAIRAEHVSKEYRLGTINHGMLYKDLQSWMARKLNRPDPHERVGKRHFEDQADRFWALKDVGFEINQGERIGIVGKNGAGKSTLLKILSRITEPTEGTIHVRGRIASLLEVGTGFHPELTGRDNIFLSGAIRGMKRRQIALLMDEIVAFSEIEKFIDTPVKRYSSGMYVRLGFAAAAFLESEILLADEVLAVGDQAFQKKCLGKMKQVSTEQGRTVIFVSHNLGAVSALCDRGLLLKSGSLVLDGSTQEIMREYLDPGVDGEARVRWEKKTGPGNENMELRAIGIRDAKGEYARNIPLSESFSVEIEYAILVDGSQPTFSLILWDDSGVCVFSAMSNGDGHENGNRPLGKGMYRSTCRIPGNLLNNGNYSISLIGLSNALTNSFRIDHVLAVKMQDDGVSRGLYSGNYSGVIRPRLPWTTVSE